MRMWVILALLNKYSIKKQKPCYMCYTNEKVHQILGEGFEKSPMFQGRIEGKDQDIAPQLKIK